MTNTRLSRGDGCAPAYPATYQPELAPSWLHHALRVRGYAYADLTRPFSYLELGCGQGFSALLHAASCPWATFHVVDSDGDAIDNLRARAQGLGIVNLTAHAMSLEALPVSLGGFDFIVAHGLYSWVDVGTRAAIRRLIGARLAPAGVAYLSYNCLPGWAPEIPLRRLLRDMDARGGGHHAFSELAYFKANPLAARALARLDTLPRGYIAQEYLAPHWDALWSVDVIGEMAEAGLAFAASATLHDNHPELLVTDSTRAMIESLPNEGLKTLSMDFALNRTLRRDLYVRADAGRGGPHRDSVDFVVACTRNACEIGDSIVVPRGKIGFHGDFIVALRELAAEGPFAIGDAANRMGKGQGESAVRNLLWLAAAGVLTPALPVREDACRFELRTVARWLRLVAEGSVPGWLPSPAVGGGVKITREEAARMLDAGEANPATRRRRDRLAALGIPARVN